LASPQVICQVDIPMGQSLLSDIGHIQLVGSYLQITDSLLRFFCTHYYDYLLVFVISSLSMEINNDAMKSYFVVLSLTRPAIPMNHLLMVCTDFYLYSCT